MKTNTEKEIKGAEKSKIQLRQRNNRIEQRLNLRLKDNKYRIEELNFANAGLSDANILFLCEKLAESSLTEIVRLDLGYNNLTLDSAKHLVLLSKIKVGFLNVSYNYFNEESYELLKNSKLFNHIFISGNNIKSVDEKEPKRSFLPIRTVDNSDIFEPSSYLKAVKDRQQSHVESETTKPTSTKKKEYPLATQLMTFTEVFSTTTTEKHVTNITNKTSSIPNIKN